MQAFLGIYKSLEQELLKESCSISRFQILFHLYFEGPLPASLLAKKLFVSRGNISTFLKRLEIEELISFSLIGPNSKRMVATLTNKGRKFFEKIFPPHIERVKKLMPQLSESFLDSLKEIKAKTEKNEEGN